MKGQTDTIYLVVMAFVFILAVAITYTYVYVPIMAQLQPSLDPATYTAINTGVTKTVDFWNYGFAAIYLLFMIGSIALSVMLASNPLFLFAWLLVNVITLMIWDIFQDLLTTLSGSMDLSAMGVALAFYTSPDIAKLIIFVNIAISIVMIGKRVLGR